MRFGAVSATSDGGLTFSDRQGEVLAELRYPVQLSIFGGSGDDWRGTAIQRTYDSVGDTDEGIQATAQVRTHGIDLTVCDDWKVCGSRVLLSRVVHPSQDQSGTGFRLVLRFSIPAQGFHEKVHPFAPPALYDLNDVDGDGRDDYVDSRNLEYRDDRLSGLAALLFSGSRRFGLALCRDSVPSFDDVPDRPEGAQGFVQQTDIGSLGVLGEQGPWELSCSFPFVERDRSHALTVRERRPWGAFYPATGAPIRLNYSLSLIEADDPVSALWSLWSERWVALKPLRAELAADIEELDALRLDALVPYYREDENTAAIATNCHPQDGEQLGDILQYGFTGQAVLNALNLLDYGHRRGDAELLRMGRAITDGFVRGVSANPHGLVETLYDFDNHRRAPWWSGLLLPLAYADSPESAAAMMGPVYEHMQEEIEALAATEKGTYLRCMAEEYAALLRVYRMEQQQGTSRDEWLTAAQRFGEFLLEVQEPDGSWRRAYSLSGNPIIEPRIWFGLAELNQKSSTATAVPFLVDLAELTGRDDFLEAAEKAGRFAAQEFIHGMKFNGGIHDSIYARPQLVDSESILFCLRAAESLYRATGAEEFRLATVAAARILATWVYLWDVPLPPGSTLGQRGFRSTGWSACDTPGAGYIHPYELHAVPDLFEAALLARDPVLASTAELLLFGSNQTVATASQMWGLAAPGLQEEGLLISWWLVEDPMFVGTGFGGRGKGEGNKTCLPWIAAIGIDTGNTVRGRYGTHELHDYWLAAKSSENDGASR